MRHRRASERGETLVELIVAVAILGLGVTALLGGLATAVFGSALHRNQADVSTVMTAAVEQVKEAPYKACAVMTDYLSPFQYPGYPPAAVTSSNSLAVKTSAGAPVWTVTFAIADFYGQGFAPRPDLATCMSFDQQGEQLQQVTVTVATADTKVSQSLPVIKRFRACPMIAAGNPGCDA